MKAAGGFSVAVVLTGVWVGVAPFVIGYAPASGSPWTGPVSISVGIGVAVACFGLIGLVGFSGGRLGELQRMMKDITEREKAEDGDRAPDVEAKALRPSARASASLEPEPGAMASESSAPYTEARLQALVERVLQDYHTGTEKGRG